MGFTIVVYMTAISKTRTLRVLDQTGDTATVYDPTNVEDVEAVRKTFDEMKALGYLSYKVGEQGEGDEVIRTFDPDADIVMSPQLIGG